MTLYAYLSGEHPTLPLAELKAILDAETGHHVIKDFFEQVALFEADLSDPSIIVLRAGMVREVGSLVAVCEADYRELKACLDSGSWNTARTGSFAVKIHYVKGFAKKSLTPEKLVEAVARSAARALNARVDLSSPELVVRVLVTEGVVVVGFMLATRPRGLMHKRRPRLRPFFKPGALSPQLSRVFVNLSRVRRSEVFLDPFCGTGGFALEASLIGAYSVCGDIDRVMAWGSRVNLKWMGLESRSDMYLGDVCRVPLRSSSVDAIGTDPPYGRSTSTRRRRVAELLRCLLYSAADALRRGRYASFASPLLGGMELEDIVGEAGMRLVEKHYMRVHRSLTRVIAVALRP